MQDAPIEPSHCRSILDIESPLSVTLARKTMTLNQILSLVPGSMLTFDIHCDQPLVLEAGETAIATGETVKIGDKFGLRIRRIGGGAADCGKD